MQRQENQEPAIELRGIDKVFGVTRALQGVDLRIYAGEVIGLVGPNGAGKSTLMKILTGVLPPTNGSIVTEGKVQGRYGAREAKEAGVACAYQDLSLCTNLTVYENFAILSMSHGLLEKPGWRGRKRGETKELLERYFPGSSIDVNRTVRSLTLAEQQIAEICKTLMTEDLRVLVLDEPTSALSTDKAEQLHQVVRAVSKKGVAVIYISHKLDEIKKVSDRIVLMRNGQIAGEASPQETSQEDLLQMMGGEIRRREAEAAEQRQPQAADIIVEANGLTGRGLSDIQMVVHRGEIVGLSGLVGSGQTGLLNAVFHQSRKKSRNPRLAVHGTASYISGDRTKEGVFPLWSIFDNILVSSLDKVRSGPLLSKQKSERLVQTWYGKLKFKAEGIHSPIMSLSGGNQQKALIARGIASDADLILLNDPTAGVDIETKQEIYGLLNEAKAAGKAVLLYSTEDAEIEICDRAYIMRDGAVTAHLAGAEITVPSIVKASFQESGKKAQADTGRRSAAKRILSSRMLLPLATMILMIVVNSFLNPALLQYNNVRMLAGSAVPLVFASLGQMFIVVSGDIDMGNGYSIGLVNVLVAVVLTGSPLAGVVSLVLFVAAYVLMGALIHLRRIPAIVVTLGAQFIWLGLALVFSPTPGGACPAWLDLLYRVRVLAFVPMPVVLCIIAALACWYVLYRSKYGMILRGIGNNPSAIGRSGWSYLAAKMTNYGLSGLMVVLAGMFFTAVCLGADANSAASFCMLSIATVILGGCEMSGGVVEPVGVVAGGIAMSLITTLLTFLKLGSNYQTAVMGIVLILVLVVKLFTGRKEGARA